MCANDWQIIDVITSIDVISTGEGIKFQSIDVISSECVKHEHDNKSKIIIGKINLSSFQKWYWFDSYKKIKWLKSNICILIFCEYAWEFISRILC